MVVSQSPTGKAGHERSKSVTRKKRERAGVWEFSRKTPVSTVSEPGRGRTGALRRSGKLDGL